MDHAHRCGPTTECTLTEPMRPTAVAHAPTEVSIPPGGAAESRHPLRIELAVLLNRLVGTERFLRRRRLTATVARPEGLGGLTS
jgi:hypothetical protein